MVIVITTVIMMIMMMIIIFIIIIMMIILVIITLIIAQGSLGSGEGREEEINQVCHFNWIIVLLLLCYCVLSHLFKSCFSFSLKSHLNISIQDGERNDGRRRKGNSRNEGGRGEDGEKIYQVLKKNQST